MPGSSWGLLLIVVSLEEALSFLLFLLEAPPQQIC